MDSRYRIGKTDLVSFPIILGTVGVGKDFGDNALDTIISKYMDLGGNALDTARMYADGRSEEALGRWFQRTGRRNSIILITKGGHPHLSFMHTGRMSEQDIRSDIEKSLSALKTDYIDLYFYHRDDLNQPVDESLYIMEKFVKEGKIRYYGCSNWSAKRIKEALDYARDHNLQGFAANQALYNIASDSMKPFPDDTMSIMDSEMKQLHREQPITSMPYFGVCSGFFYILKNSPIGLENSPYYTEKNLLMAKRIYELTEKYHTNITTILLGFFFAQDFFNMPLYGPTEACQLDDLKDLFRVQFDQTDFVL